MHRVTHSVSSPPSRCHLLAALSTRLQPCAFKAATLCTRCCSPRCSRRCSSAHPLPSPTYSPRRWWAAASRCTRARLNRWESNTPRCRHVPPSLVVRARWDSKSEGAVTSRVANVHTDQAATREMCSSLLQVSRKKSTVCSLGHRSLPAVVSSRRHRVPEPVPRRARLPMPRTTEEVRSC